MEFDLNEDEVDEEVLVAVSDRGIMFSASSSSSSPISLSPNGSEYGGSSGGSGEEEETGDHVVVERPQRPRKPQKKFRPLTFDQVEQSLDRYYYDDEGAAAHGGSGNSSDSANELDILITYLKGQKNLHLQSKAVCEMWLNMMLIPTLLITTAITICAPFLQAFSWSGGFISGLNAMTACLISLVKYLKLESSVEMFHHTIHQFDKLETSVEFTTSKLMFVVEPEQRTRIVLEKIQEIEKKVSEIKEWNSQIVPAEVVRVFPVICNVNIFSFIKRVEGAKRVLIAKFKDVKNEIRYIEYKMGPPTAQNNNKFSRRLDHLLEVKEKMKEELLHHRQAYCHIDQIFTREIRAAQLRRDGLWMRCFCSWFSWCFFLDASSSALGSASLVSTNSVVDRFLVQNNPYVVVNLP